MTVSALGRVVCSAGYSSSTSTGSSPRPLGVADGAVAGGGVAASCPVDGEPFTLAGCEENRCSRDGGHDAATATSGVGSGVGVTMGVAMADTAGDFMLGIGSVEAATAAFFDGHFDQMRYIVENPPPRSPSLGQIEAEAGAGAGAGEMETTVSSLGAVSCALGYSPDDGSGHGGGGDGSGGAPVVECSQSHGVFSARGCQPQDSCVLAAAAAASTGPSSGPAGRGGASPCELLEEEYSDLVFLNTAGGNSSDMGMGMGMGDDSAEWPSQEEALEQFRTGCQMQSSCTWHEQATATAKDQPEVHAHTGQGQGQDQAAATDGDGSGGRQKGTGMLSPGPRCIYTPNCGAAEALFGEESVLANRRACVARVGCQYCVEDSRLLPLESKRCIKY